eukprot:7503322-Ditylum_brightwellii.AAC.1
MHTPSRCYIAHLQALCTLFDEGTLEEWIKFQRRLQAVLNEKNIMQGPASCAVAKTLFKGDALTVFERAVINHSNQTLPHFKICLDDVAEHVFPEKAGQAQKRYMQRNLQLGREMTDFPAHNRNCIQPLNKDKLLDILEYGVPVPWHIEFTVKGFDPVDQGLRKSVEFCTCLELCEPIMDKPKDKKSPKSENAGKRKADTPTRPAGKKKFYCNMHGLNKTHGTEDCFDLKWHAKCTKTNTTQNEADKVTSKDLNAFVNAKVTVAFNKAKKI